MCGQEKELWNELSSSVLWLLLFFSLHTGHLRPGHLSCQCNLMPISLVTEKVMRCHHPLLLSYTFTKWKYNSRKNTTGLYMKRWKKTDLKSVATAGLLGKMALCKMKAVLHEVSVMGWIVFPQKGILKSQPLAPVNVSLPEKRVFADLIKLRSSRARLEWALNPMTGVIEQLHSECPTQLGLPLKSGCS